MQAGLSTAYYLKRKGFDPLILDANDHFDGSWQHAWDSLKLFSPKALLNQPCGDF
ncbi:NAD(P)-binding protein [Pseudoalteromonas sp. '520P1 No. 423']|uniref:NAD(P)-binding protein n=1 Tax=Pseudoalteromonas sp. '520P1 No. 423' TaxID=1690037 RepID=UPI000AB5558C